MTYKNGSYTATATYAAPSGTETIKVALTITSNNVTAAKVTSVTVDAAAATWEAKFESGISAAVVGKPIATLSVKSVGGASLPSAGFTTALTAIKTQAKG